MISIMIILNQTIRFQIMMQNYLILMYRIVFVFYMKRHY